MSYFSNPIVEIRNETTLAVTGTITQAVDIKGNPVYDRIGQGSFRVPYFADDVNAIQDGRIAYAYTQSSLSANPFVLTAFIIQNRRVVIGIPLMYEISGPELTGELLERHMGENIVAEITSTTLATAVANMDVYTTLDGGESGGATTIEVASATYFLRNQQVSIALTSGSTHTTTISSVSGTTIGLTESLPSAAANGNEVVTNTGRVYNTLASGASAGASTVTVNNATGFLKGQPISVSLDAGGSHSTSITNVSGTILTLNDVLPGTAAADNEVSSDRGYVTTVASATNFAAGQPVFIELDDGNTFSSSIAEVSGTTITMADGLEDGTSADAGNTITTHKRALDDIDQIMAYAPAGWTNTGNTASGSYHVFKGETVYEALEQARQQGGGHFRLSSTPLTRDIEWLTAPDDSGIDLVMPATATHADMSDATKGIILSLDQEDARDWPLVTRVQARGANGLTFALAQPHAIVPGDYDVNWDTGVITHTAVEATFPRKDRYMVFGHIEPTGDNDAAAVQAAINLYEVALNWLAAQSSAPRFFNARVIVHDNIAPFSFVNINYTQNHGLSSFAIGSGGERVVHEVSYSIDEKGRVVTDLRLGDDTTWRPKDDAEFIGSAIRDIRTTLRHISGGGSGTISGGTIVNVSAGQGISVFNSIVSVRLASPSGLSFAAAGGLQIDDTVAGGGLTIASKILAVGTPGSVTSTSTNAVTADSHTHAIDSTIVTTARTVTAGAGLTGGGALSANITINVGDGDGLVVNADDVALGTPGSITSTSTNSVTAASHTHAIDATIAPVVTLTAGAGLTGGGTTAANRTFNVGDGDGIVVNADDVALGTPSSITSSSTNSVTASSHTHAIDSTIAASAITLTAGAGLTGGGNLTANRTFTVGAGAGITVNADDVALTTPGTLTVSSTNSASGNHTHAITSSASITSNFASILASDSNGRLRLRALGVDTAAPTTGFLGVSSQIYINETANSDMTNGITINASGSDQNIAIKNTNAVIDMTDFAEFDTICSFEPFSLTEGGIRIWGFSEGNTAINLRGAVTSGNSSSNGASSLGPIVLQGELSNGAGGTTSMGANHNVVVIRNRGNAIWMVDDAGDTHRDGTDNTFDAYDDVQLARAFTLATAPDKAIRSEFDSFLQYGRDDLIAAGILHESGFYNESQLQRLLVGATWQLHQRIAQLEEMINE